MTPMEFARGAAARVGEGQRNGILYITGLYNRVRFGGVPVSRAEREGVRLALDGLRRTAPR